MEYTVHGLAKLAGISSRTLRYYDEIGILKPLKINSSGYRIYGQEQVDKLQQILFYRELGVSLEEIKEIIADPGFDVLKALRSHREKLMEKRKQLDLLISNVEKTIAEKEGKTKMSDREKFEGFKKRLVRENEEKYGREVHEKFGADALRQSNEKLLDMSREQYEELEKLTQEVLDTLDAAFKTGDPAGELAQKAAELHKRWLCYFWNEYSREAHANLARMYVADPRFKAYYDRNQTGTAEFLRDAILIYTDRLRH